MENCQVLEIFPLWGTCPELGQGNEEILITKATQVSMGAWKDRHRLYLQWSVLRKGGSADM